ncbi:maltodextrose utilization protein MalA [Listeria floridensis FSL S10-1187]|uniref:Maltodextrose utilization protein MalA n=1 Tax=Listeria floridensis FSL S10-1187 TaxID=1265817 RepID=A0ABP3B0E7_9LIST|nr:hypothetical protein [Listeria floridensis]EUJ32033.1 maltodextrose utilization protein MalA [Listeria floridensis FSL S10-1187]
MKKQSFPTLYFPNLFNPYKIFSGRKNLSWPKLIFCFILLNALLLIPVTLHQAKQTSFDLNQVFPEAGTLINDKLVGALSGSELKDGELVQAKQQSFQDQNNLSGVLVSERQIAETQNVIAFNQTEIVLQNEHYHFNIRYPAGVEMKDLSSVEAVQDFTAEAFFKAYQPIIFLTMVLILGSLTLVSTLLLTVFSAGVLLLTKKKRVFKDRYF